MITDPDDWHAILAGVAGVLAAREHRVTTQELFAKHLGIAYTDKAARRLRRVMRDLGWLPKVMRLGGKTMHGYCRPPTGDLPAMPASAQSGVQDEPTAEIATTMRDGSLAPELEKVTVLGLKKLKTILTHRTDFTDGNLLRAQTAAASTAIHAQLKADETRLRQKTQGDVLERLLRAIEVEKARQAKAAPLQLDLSSKEDGDGEAA
jgi:hypothetical protein